MTTRHGTLIDALDRASATSHQLSTMDATGKQRRLTYGELRSHARRILHNLQAQGIHPGDEVIIQLDAPEEFIRVFWACLLGKIVVVPIQVATHQPTAAKLVNVWRRLRAPRLVTDKKHYEQLRRVVSDTPLSEAFAQIESAVIFHQQLPYDDSIPDGQVQNVNASDIAFVQYSSGSTGMPKGVMLTHTNLLTNIDAIRQAYHLDQKETSTLSWLPLTHDMGIVGYHLMPLALGINQYIIATGIFIRRPIVWLRKLTEERTTLTGSPNFGYRYLLRSANLNELDDIDLSAVRTIVNGAEPISATLCEEFTGRLARFGLRREALHPSYGMAEASLLVTAATWGQRVNAITINRSKLRLGQPVIAPELEGDDLHIVDLGQAAAHVRLRIVDHDQQPLGERHLGHVQIQGDSVTPGYYNDPEATASAFTDDGWFRTGDIGFLASDRLFLAGRSKDVIFANGQNFYSHDLEEFIAEQTGIDLRKLVVVSAPSAGGHSETVILFQAQSSKPAQVLTLQQTLTHLLPSSYGCPLHRVLPVPAIPITTSGKKQRYQLRERYLAGEFDELAADLDALASAQREPADSAWRSELEARVAEVCRQLLPDACLGRCDDLYSSGLDSLGAMRLAHELSKTFEVALPPDSLQVHSSIAAIAHRLGDVLAPASIALTDTNERLCERFGTRVQLVRYNTETDQILVLFCSKSQQPIVIHFMTAEIIPPVFPDHIRPTCQPSMGAVCELQVTQSQLAQTLGLSKYEPGKFSTTIAPQVTQVYKRFANAVTDAPIIDVFMAGPLQRRHLRRNLTHPQVFSVTVTREPSERRIYETLIDFIAAQDLLRATLVKDGEAVRFHVHASQRDLFIPTLDLSGYTEAAQKQMIREVQRLLATLLEDESVIGRPLYTILLIRCAPTSFSVLFLLNHLISDHESGRILEYFLEQRLHVDAPMQEVQSYSHFLARVAEPGVAATERIIKTSIFEKVRAAVDELAEYRATPIPFSRPVSIEFPYEFLRGTRIEDHDRPANYALYVYLLIARSLFPSSHLPVKVSLNRRVFGNYSYRNTIGEFHENLILTVSGEKLSPETCHNAVGATLRFMNTQGYLLAAMKDEPSLREVAGATPLSFNYLGEVGRSEDRYFLEELRPFPLTFFPSLSYSIENRFVRILFNNGIALAQMESVRQTLGVLGHDFDISILQQNQKALVDKQPVHSSVPA